MPPRLLPALAQVRLNQDGLLEVAVTFQDGTSRWFVLDLLGSSVATTCLEDDEMVNKPLCVANACVAGWRCDHHNTTSMTTTTTAMLGLASDGHSHSSTSFHVFGRMSLCIQPSGIGTVEFGTKLPHDPHAVAIHLPPPNSPPIFPHITLHWSFTSTTTSQSPPLTFRIDSTSALSHVPYSIFFKLKHDLLSTKCMKDACGFVSYTDAASLICFQEFKWQNSENTNDGLIISFPGLSAIVLPMERLWFQAKDGSTCLRLMYAHNQTTSHANEVVLGANLLMGARLDMDYKENTLWLSNCGGEPNVVRPDPDTVDFVPPVENTPALESSSSENFILRTTGVVGVILFLMGIGIALLWRRVDRGTKTSSYVTLATTSRPRRLKPSERAGRNSNKRVAFQEDNLVIHEGEEEDDDVDNDDDHDEENNIEMQINDSTVQ